MKKLFYLVVILCFGFAGLQAQTVEVNSAGCFGGAFTFTLAGTDGSGRNIYENTVLDMEIRYNTGNSRWEVVNFADFNDVFFFADYTSSPNPPDSGTAAWEDNFACDGLGNAIVSGDGTQDNVGGDPCAALGGDSDGDGVCNDNDVCPGFDDHEDMDEDTIPDACDANPGVPDGVLLRALCLTPDPIVFLLSGTDATGRNIYSNNNFQVDVRYNAGAGRWEILAQSPGTEVFFYNDFPSFPDPPASGTGVWTGSGTVCDGSSPDEVNGSGTQNDLGCTISIADIAISEPVCGNDGSITVMAAGAKGDVSYTISGAASATNATGVFEDLGSGMYTIVVSDGAFPAGVCTDSDTRTLAEGSDTEPPVPACPADIEVDSDPDECGALVNFTVTAADNCDGSPTITIDPASGSFFALGTTTVTATATDDATNTADCSFTVTVNDTENCSGGCPPGISSEAIDLPFSYDGVGEFCWVTDGNINFINSWSLALLEVNGVNYTNQWTTNMPPRIDGKYYFHYVSNFSWGHFEVDGFSPSTNNTCDNPVPINLPFSKNGVGEFCWETSDNISYVNSWNLSLLEINGVNYTNQWSGSLPPKIDGKYFISYSTQLPWGHFEAGAASSLQAPDGIFRASSPLDHLGLELFPNPAKSTVTINLQNVEDGALLNIFDQLGRMVWSQQLAEGQEVLQLDLQNGVFKNGIYLVSLISQGERKTVRLLVTK